MLKQFFSYPITLFPTSSCMLIRLMAPLFLVTLFFPTLVSAQTTLSSDDFVLKITTTAGHSAAVTFGSLDRGFTFYTQDTDYDIDWDNDGMFEVTHASGNTMYRFPSAGEYTIRFRNLTDIHIASDMDRGKYTSIEQWGTAVWDADMSSAFRGASNLTGGYTDTPNMSAVTSMASMFQVALSFNSDLSGWNTASVTDMRGMFASARSFNSDLSGWNTASVTDMSNMFRDARSFNSDISGWDTASVTDMREMFQEARNFNQDVGGWDVSELTNAGAMFAGIKISPENYDALLIGWAAQDLQTGVVFSGGGSRYTLAARPSRAQILESWPPFIDGGVITSDQAPSTIFLSSTDILENTGENAVVGTLSTNGGDAITYYTLEAGDGDTDNGSFRISGAALRLRASADYETKRTYSVRIKPKNTLLSKKFTISVIERNEAPTINDAAFIVEENPVIGVAVGTVTATDPDQTSPDNTLRYSITAGNTGNAFAIETMTGVITVAGALNRATTPVYLLTVTVEDGGTPALSDTATITITVTRSSRDDFVLKITTTAGTDPNDQTFAFYTQDTDYEIDWGNDGTFEVTDANETATYTFPTAGVHTIRFRDLTDIYINNRTGKEKYTSIEQWGNAVWNADMNSAFRGANNLIGNYMDTPNMSAVTNMRRMFDGATSFNGDLSGWNTASVISMLAMFADARSFNGDLSGWNVEAVTSMNFMFFGVTLSPANYDALLIGWNAQNLRSEVSFNAGLSQYSSNDAHAARENMMATTASGGDGWTISDGGRVPPNQAPTIADARFNVTASATTGSNVGTIIATDFENSTLTYSITAGNTGDAFAIETMTGVITVAGALDRATTPVYSLTVTVEDGGTPALSDTATITITVTRLSRDDFVLKITTTASDETFVFHTQDTDYEIDWGNDGIFEVTDANGNATHTFSIAGVHTIRFRNLTDIRINNRTGKEKYTSIEQWGTAVWDADMSSAFNGANNLTGGYTDTPNMSAVTSMASMFQVALSFNSDLSGWNTASVTDMRGMFQDAASFNGDLSSWNTAAVIDMISMFRGATSFNRDISRWNTAAVRDINSMFRDASSFNGDLSSWNTVSVTSMWRMFSGASSFNRDISRWNTAAVRDINSMFRDASSFNGDVSGWNTASVTNMNRMFQEATSFNSDLSSWNTASVMDMTSMFFGATSFNGDVSGWNTASVTNMSRMFQEATSFNSDLSDWNVEAVISDMDILNGVTLSPANYDALLIGWNAQNLRPRTLFSAGSSQYSSDAAHAARTNMMAPTADGGHGWSIDDGGRVPPNQAPTINDATFGVAENAMNGVAVGTVTATDPDQTSPNNTLTYSITAGNTGNAFAIETMTGVITVAGALNPATTLVYLLIVTVEDGGTPALSDTATITVNVLSPDDFVLKITTTAGTNTNDRDFAFYTQDTDYEIDWDNDGIFEVTNANETVTYTFPIAGVHTIRFRNLTDIHINNSLGREKYTSIEQWGTAVWNADMSRAFDGANNLTANYTDTPDMSAVTNMRTMFNGASSFNGDLSRWNTAAVTNMNYMFSSASSFNSDISGWNTAAVTGMEAMFANATSFNGDLSRWNVEAVTSMQFMFEGTMTMLSPANYDALLIGWNAQNLRSGVPFNAGRSQYSSDAAHAARTNMMASDAWIITDGGRVPPNQAPTINDATFGVAENAMNGVAVGTVTATDPDQTSPNNTLKHSITAGNTGNAFAIETMTGVITVAGVLNRATTPVYSLIVTVEDGGTPALSDTATITVNVLSPEDDFVLKITTTAGTNTNDRDFAFYTQDTDYEIDWDNDGIFEVTNANETVTYTFPIAGVHTIRFRNLTDIHINNSLGREKYTSIEQWGTAVWNADMSRAFDGANNLTANYTDTPDMSAVTNMRTMFNGASSFNGDLSGWNTAAVTNMNYMFSSATSFNSDISGWNTAAVTGMEAMFANATSFNGDLSRWNVEAVTSMQFMFEGTMLSPANYDALLIGWNAQNLRSGVPFDAGRSQYSSDDAQTARANMMATTASGGDAWIITDGGRVTPNQAPTINDATFGVAENAMNGVAVGTVTATDPDQTSPNNTLTYSITAGNTGNAFAIETMTGVITLARQLNHATTPVYSLIVTVEDGGTPALSDTATITVNVLSPDDFVLKITTTAGTNTNDRDFAFYTQDTDYEIDWDNDGIFEVTNANETVTYTFPIAGVHTIRFRNLTDIHINNSLGREKYTSIEQWGTAVWNADMSRAFDGANNLTANYTDTPDMSAVTNMRTMFNGASSFNGDMSGWNTAAVTNMNYMFSSATSFNSDISGWNTAAVTGMEAMFANATSFNGDLSRWNVEAVTSMQFMFEGTMLSPANYDALLIGWNAQNLRSGVPFDAGRSQYSSDDAQTARANMMAPTADGGHGWTISDGGQFNQVATGLPTIGGTLTQGVTLTALVSDIPDIDGLDTLTFTYQWQVGGNDISGATSPTFTLTQSEVGQTITVTVSYTDTAAVPRTLTSPPSTAVINVNDDPVGVPTISGTPTQGQILTAEASGITDVDGPDTLAFTYQWRAGINVIRGTTGSTLTLTSAQVGQPITVTAYYTDNEGTDETVTSVATPAVASGNVPPVGVPIINGTVTEEKTLTADASGISDDNGPDTLTFTYQWQAGGSDISGATSLTFTLTDAQVGQTITVTVRYTDNGGTDETVTSVATTAVARGNVSPRGLPTISGSLTYGVTLMSDISDISDADGLDTLTFTYQWQADGTDISDATSSTFTLTNAQVGQTITVTVRYTDSGGAQETVTSTPAGRVNTPIDGVPIILGTVSVGQILTADLSGISDVDGLNLARTPKLTWYIGNGRFGGPESPRLESSHVGQTLIVVAQYTDNSGNLEFATSTVTAAITSTNQPSSGKPTISGTLTQGQILTAETSGISDADGLMGVTFGYQWRAGGNVISGATSLTLTLTNAQAGQIITFTVRYTDNGNTQETVTSDATTAVVRSNMPPSGVPTITGIPTQGEILTADASGITDADGLTGVTFSYQWQANGTAITDDATSSTFTLTNAQVGQTITVTVRYTDDNGTDETLSSVATPAVTNINDDPVGLPTITGTVTQGQVLTANTAGISDVDGLNTLTFTYQWQADGTAISGATSSTFTLTDAQVGQTITVTVRYTDDNGTDETLSSVATSAVANVNDEPVGSVTIGGTVTQGQVLTADASGVSDADGLGTLNYQWQAGGTDISDATSSTFTLTQTQVGQTITVTVSYTDNGGRDETVTSVATSAVTDTNNPSSGLPTITGTPTQGQTLMADATGIRDIDGPGTFSYQWQAGGNVIIGATSSTFTLTQSQVGQTITVTVRYTDGGGTDETVSSVATLAVANANDDPVGLPTISGTVTQGQILTAETSGISDADGLGTFSYQWQADGTAITDGATSSTFTLTNAQVGQTITVTVRYTDNGGFQETVNSNPTATVANINDAPVGSIIIDGTPAQGQILTADVSGITDADGLDTLTFTYQWQADGIDITDDATSLTFTLTQSQVGQTITVTVRYTDNGGFQETVNSNPTATVDNVNDAPVGAIIIDGTPAQGQILTADVSGITDADGLDTLTFTYQWQADGIDITDDATSLTFTLTQSQVGQTITVTVRYTDGGGAQETVNSNPTATVDNINDAPVGAIIIDGTPAQGQILTADVSGITDADGLDTLTFTYQWQADGIDITGDATSLTFTLTQSQVGQTITVTVRYTDGGGAQETVNSNPTATVANANDDPVGLPTISGTVTQGGILTAETSGISDADGLGTLSYQWQADGIDITDDATSSTFTLTDAQVGQTITVTVRYTDGGGAQETVTSIATPAVTEINNPVSGELTISGTVTQGEILTAETSDISDADGLDTLTFTYQWQADGTDISDATSSTFTLTNAQVGQTITVTVRYTDNNGTLETVDSIATSAVINANDSPVGLPTISGTPIQEQTLTANTAGITDADGLTGVTFGYQWQADGIDITDDATSSTFTLTQSQVGQTITVTVSYTDNGNTDETVTSDATAAVGNINDAPVGLPTITGTPTQGEILTANTAGISDADGLDTLTFTYQWQADGIDITDDATSSTFTLTQSQVGQTITVTVSYTDNGNTDETVTSVATPAVGNINDAPVGLPTITGTVTQGQILTADASGITDADGLTGVTFGYQWQADGIDITDDATSSTFTLTQSQVGQTITVTVHYTDNGNMDETVDSIATTAVANANDEPVGLPTITGTPTQRQILTAETSGITDTDGLDTLTFTYQWQADGVDISGATSSTFTLTQSQVGQTITVTVSYTDNGNTDETVTSVATTAVANVNDAPVGAIIIDGTPTQGEILTVNTAGISDADGLTGVTFGYQWQADGIDITDDATSSTFTLTQSQVGQTITVTVSYTDNGNMDETVTSVATPAVGNINDAPVGLPTITGTVTQGEILTADASGITDADGLTGVTFGYQWQADGIDITDDATSSTFTLTQSQVGQTITVTVHYTDNGNMDETVDSIATTAVANANDEPVGLPTITGTPTQRQILTAETSGITDTDGLDTLTFTYQWQADGVDISGATSSTFTLTQSQVGQTITVTVSYTDNGNTDETVTSVATTAVANVNDAPVGSVTIDGTPTQGQILTADASGISDVDGPNTLTFTYQWQADGVDISEATSSTFTLTQSQVGQTITVTVSYDDGGGTDETVTSDATTAVTNVNDSPDGLPTITGTLTQGEILTADASGITDVDGLTGVTFGYQWQADGIDITDDATSSTFTLTQSQVGQTITVTVSYNDGGGTDETVTSDATTAVTNVNDSPDGLPTITGTVTQGQVLTADVSGITDVDGLTGVVFAYQWQANGIDITDDATSSTFTLTNAQVGQTIAVIVRYTDNGNTLETVSSVVTPAVSNANDAPVGLPSISGTLTQGQVLTADVSGISDVDGLMGVTFGYQWQSGGTDISGETGSTLTLTNAQVGQTITITVSYTDNGNMPETVSSVATTAVANINDSPSGLPTITGTVTQGQILTADVSGISDVDGLTGVTFDYQWQADGTAISDATSSTFTLTNAQVGQTITVTVSYTDVGNTPETVTSVATSAVTNANDGPSGLPIITGMPTQGQVLTADASGITDADGLTGVTFAYQWQADGNVISGETGSTLTLTNAQVGQTITVRVRYTDNGNRQETVISDATSAVANVNDEPVGSVTIGGTVTQGQVLTADASGVSDADGLGTLNYQWQAGGTDISDATSSTFTLTNAQVGQTITVTVSYTDNGGRDETVTSVATSAVTDTNTPSSGSVTIGGTVTQGQVLTADASGVSDADGPGTFSYQWQAGGNVIIGATSSTFTLTQAQVGQTITVTVRYTDGGGTDETVSSVATLAVANANDDPVGLPTISGTVTQGQILTAETSGISDADGLGTFSYQWQADGTAITDGATSSTFTLTNAQVGQTITVTVSYTDNGGRDETVTSVATLAVANINDSPSGLPTIEGTPTQRQVLTANTSGITDADGPNTLTFTYQWQADGFDIRGETDSTLTLTQSQVGQTIAVRVRYTDGGGTQETVTSVATSAVANANDAPTISGTPTTTVAEDSAYHFMPMGTDVDASTTLVYLITNKPSWAIFDTATGILSGTPRNMDVMTTTEIVITVSDGTASTDLGTFSITVTNVNDRPTITGTPATRVAEDRAYSFTPGGGDVDASTTLTYSINPQPSWASFDTATGTLSGTPSNTNVGTTRGIVITVSDSSLTASLSPFDLEVTNINDRPTITGTPTTTVNEDTAYSFTPMGADDDAGTTLTYSINTQPSWASFDTATGTLSGMPDNGDVGTTRGIVITVFDGSERVSLPSFNLQVINANDAPTITGTPTTTVNEDIAYSFTPGGGDVDVGDTPVYSINPQPSWARFDATTGALTGTPTNADVGTTRGIVITVTSGGETALLQPFDLEVTNVNDRPTITGTPTTTVAEDTAYSFMPMGADVDDGTTLTYSINPQPSWASFDTATGTLSGTPSNMDVGTTTGIVITVSDGDLTASLLSFDLEVTNVNDRPTITGTPTTTVAEDTAYSFTPGGGDDDAGTTLTYSINPQPSWASFDTATGMLSGTPSNMDVGTTTGIVITVSDGFLPASLQPFDLEVTNVNDRPTITGTPTTTVAEDTAYSFMPMGADVDDGTTLTYSINPQPSWASFDTATGTLSGTPSNMDVGTTTGIVITVSDGDLTASLLSFDLEVTNVNDRPTITGTPTTTVAEDTAYSFTPGGGDDDAGTTLTYSINPQPSWASFDTATGMLSGTPSNMDVGTTTGIVITVSDGFLPASLQPFDLEVTNVNDRPTITGTPTTTVAEDTAYSFMPMGADVDDGTTLTYSINPQPSWASFDTATGTLSGTPSNMDVGTTTGIVITVSDGSLMASLPSFNLQVINVNDAPIITGTPSTTVTEGSEYSFTPTVVDVDAGTTLTYSINLKPSWASFDTATGTLSGTPADSDVGSTTTGIVITVSDGSLTASLPAFNIAVFNLEGLMVSTSAISIREGETGEFTVKLQSPPSEDVTVTAVSSDTDEARVSSPALIFTPDNWEEIQTVTIRAVDNKVDDGDGIFTITLTVTSADKNYNGPGLVKTVSGISLDDEGPRVGTPVGEVTVLVGASVTIDITGVFNGGDLGISDLTYEFTTADSNIATVSGNAVTMTVTAVSAGKIFMTVVATASDGNKTTQTFTVVVVAPNPTPGSTVTETVAFPAGVGGTTTTSVAVTVAATTGMNIPGARIVPFADNADMSHYINGIEPITNAAVIAKAVSAGFDILKDQFVDITVQKQDSAGGGSVCGSGSSRCQVTLSYTEADLRALEVKNVKDLLIIHYDREKEAWEALDKVDVDTITMTITAYTSSFSPFGLATRGALNKELVTQLNREIMTVFTQNLVASTVASVENRMGAAFSGTPQGAGYQFDGQTVELDAQTTMSNSFQDVLERKLPTYLQSLTDDTLDLQRMLSNSSFVLPLNASAGGSTGNDGSNNLTIWGSSNYSTMSGNNTVAVGTLDWKGNMFGLQLGVDKTLHDGLLVGGLLSWSKGKASFTQDNKGGDYNHTMFSIHPYAARSVDDVEVWSSAGLGRGNLEIEQDGDKGKASTRMLSLSGGFKRQLSESGLNIKSDISLASTKIGKMTVVDFPGGTVNSQRLRLLLESSRERTLESGKRMTPTLEAGLRYDGGDGKKGLGIALGAGVRFASVSGLIMEGKFHTLVGQKDYKEWGIRGELRKPADVNGLGLSFALIPSYGRTADVDQVWQAVPGGSDARDYQMTVKASLGYGLFASGGRGLVSPYIEATMGDNARNYRMGVTWQRGKVFDLQLSGERAESGNGTGQHRVLLESRIRF